MNRRHFMSSTAALAATAFVPLPLLAKTNVLPGEKTAAALEAVFAFMEDYGFLSVDTKAGLFSYYPKSFLTLASLKEQVNRYALKYGSCDHWARVEFMLTIRQNLTERFGDDLTAHLAWFDTPNSDLYGETPRQMMTTLSYPDMMHVVKVSQPFAST